MYILFYEKRFYSPLSGQESWYDNVSEYAYSLLAPPSVFTNPFFAPGLNLKSYSTYRTSNWMPQIPISNTYYKVDLMWWINRFMSLIHTLLLVVGPFITHLLPVTKIHQGGWLFARWTSQSINTALSNVTYFEAVIGSKLVDSSFSLNFKLSLTLKEYICLQWQVFGANYPLSQTWTC